MLPQHKKLLQYLPPFLQEIAELREIADAEQREADGLWKGFEDADADLCILTATEEGLSRRERALGIKPKGDAAPEERRFVLLARYNEKLPFTRRVLEQQLESLCGEDGYTLSVDGEKKEASVLVALQVKSNFHEVEKLLERVLPCNLTLCLSLKYNQHQTLGKYTHAGLAARTYGELRNEVLG